jgi:hypothetical protein
MCYTILALALIFHVPVFVPTTAHLAEPAEQLVDCIRLGVDIAHCGLDVLMPRYVLQCEWVGVFRCFGQKRMPQSV